MKVDKRLITALLYIAVGALLCAFKDQIINWILTAVGVVFILNGIVQIANKQTANGILNVVVGVAIIAFGWTMVWLAMLVFGALLIITAIVDYTKSNKSKANLAKLLVSLIVGGLLIFCGFETISWLFIVIGVALIIQGILQIVTLLKK